MTETANAKLTVAELLARGIDEVRAMCPRCGRRWRSPLSFLPPTTALLTVAKLMSCPTCGGHEIEVEPTDDERIAH